MVQSANLNIGELEIYLSASLLNYVYSPRDLVEPTGTDESRIILVTGSRGQILQVESQRVGDIDDPHLILKIIDLQQPGSIVVQEDAAWKVKLGKLITKAPPVPAVPTLSEPRPEEHAYEPPKNDSQALGKNVNRAADSGHVFTYKTASEMPEHEGDVKLDILVLEDSTPSKSKVEYEGCIKPNIWALEDSAPSRSKVIHSTERDDRMTHTGHGFLDEVLQDKYKKASMVSMHSQTSGLTEVVPAVSADSRNRSSKVKCPHCRNSFNRRYMKLHLSLEHGRKRRKRGSHLSSSEKRTSEMLQETKEHNYTCEQCGKGFTYQASYNKHTILHEDWTTAKQESHLTRRSSLPETNTTRKNHPVHSSTKLTKVKHQEHNSASSDVASFVCAECKTGFVHQRSYRQHMASVHSDTKPYKCAVCGRRYSRARQLTRHQWTHTGEKPFSCPTCRKSFASAELLSSHSLRHCDSRPPHPCQLCHKCFATPFELSRHSTAHTDRKMFLCPKCGKSFKSSDNVRRHMLIHAGTKMHACSLCDYTSNQAGNLRTHSKIHTREKPHMCDLCGNSFASSQSLRHHLTRHDKAISG